MKDYERKDVDDESELEYLVRHAPHLIEPGLKFVDHQYSTKGGRLDVLLVDSSGAAVVAELKAEEDDNMLWQALDYYDYVNSNLDGISRVYRKFGIKATMNPRLMLIAPSFSHRLINRCKWLSEDIQTDLLLYQKIHFRDTKEETIVYMPVNIPRKPGIEVEIPSQEQLIAMIRNTANQKLATHLLTSIKGWDTRINFDRKTWGISIKYKNKVIAYWEPRKSGYQRIGARDDEGEWVNLNLKEKDDLARVLELVKANYERVSGETIEETEPKEET